MAIIGDKSMIEHRVEAKKHKETNKNERILFDRVSFDSDKYTPISDGKER